MKRIKLALAGNPNSGKSTVFNALTGSRQHVGNWPGKTVERKFGRFTYNGFNIEVTDLPGSYSLTAFSEEESIARDFILDGQADVVVAIVDASNLERNLYLVTQILESQARMILALNMSDKADKIGHEIDIQALCDLLVGIPVIRMVAIRGEGIQELRDTIVSIAEHLIDTDTEVI
jgi:ferrous iron transport protein B